MNINPNMDMNFQEDGYRAMLNSFRTSDLQALLATFGRNKAGRKNELKERALDLLRNRQPPGFDHQLYCQKIMEIFRSSQHDVPHNDMLRNFVQTQQRQIVTLQAPQRVFPPPQYPQQPMHFSRAGLPQVMPQQISRGVYANNANIQYAGYQPVQLRNIPQAVTNQQLNLIVQDPMVYDMNVLGGNNIYNQLHLPSMNNVKFRKLPFFEVICEIIKPMVLNGQDRCTLPNVSRGNLIDVKEITHRFQLSGKHATDIAMNRDMSEGKCEYHIQLQLRICQLESGLLEINDLMPLGLTVRINGKIIPLPPAPVNVRPGKEARRSPRPINCSHYAKLNPNLQNAITVNWTPDPKVYAIGLFLVRHLSAETLLKRLIEKGGRSSDETKNYIIKKLAIDDPDLATTSYRVSLMCPLGKMIMKIPAKSIHCNHELRCFDAGTFILMNEKKPTWTCPTCNKICLYEDLQIQSYFLDIVSSPALTDSCKEIEILADGTWRVYEESKDTKGEDTPVDNKEKPPMDSVNLDSDDETPVELQTDPNLECSKETNDLALKSSFIDLTLSDDDEGTTKSKQENEAQAANVAQIPTAVDKKPQAQVQPKQAVTSSEQGDVIEIDSPTPPSSPALPSTPS